MVHAVEKPADPVAMFVDIFENILNQRDADALVPYWHENIVEEFPTGTVRGRAAVRDYFAGLFAALPDFRIQAKSIIGEDDHVFVSWRLSATFSGKPWMGIEPTGTRVTLDGVDRFTLRDGLIIHNEVIYDQLAFARQLGMLPAEGSAGDRAMLAAFNLKTRLRQRLGR